MGVHREVLSKRQSAIMKRVNALWTKFGLVQHQWQFEEFIGARPLLSKWQNSIRLFLQYIEIFTAPLLNLDPEECDTYFMKPRPPRASFYDAYAQTERLYQWLLSQ